METDKQPLVRVVRGAFGSRYVVIREHEDSGVSLFHDGSGASWLGKSAALELASAIFEAFGKPTPKPVPQPTAAAKHYWLTDFGYGVEDAKAVRICDCRTEALAQAVCEALNRGLIAEDAVAVEKG